jgi:ketosteroid isomerase-like protein
MIRRCWRLRIEEVAMATQQAIDEADIRQRIGKWAEAIRAMDLEAVMSVYAPDIVSFDLDPPLSCAGEAAKRKRWIGVFAMYGRLLDYEVRDLTITSGADVAFGHSLNRIVGTLKSGQETDFWLRWTTCLRKVDGNWLIAHEQLSVPIDPKSGQAALNLEPDRTSQA